MATIQVTSPRAIGPYYGYDVCMVEGCEEVVSGWFTMCRSHWAMVPKAIPDDGSETSEGSLVDAFWRNKPDHMVGPGAAALHKSQVELAVTCVEIQIAEEAMRSGRAGIGKAAPSGCGDRRQRKQRAEVAPVSFGAGRIR